MPDEKIFFLKGQYNVSYMEGMPTRQHQIEEEISQKEREFAGSIYYQRCLEKGNF